MQFLIRRLAAGNIRQLVLFGISVSILGFSLLGGLSYNYLLQIEDALALAEVVDDLSSDILEIRRYEKNYLLYAMEEDHAENLVFIGRALDVIERIEPGGGGVQGTDLRGSDGLRALRRDLHGYRDTFSRLGEVQLAGQLRERERGALREDLREQGKALVAQARQIVTYQRERILGIVGSLKHQLLLSIGAMVGLATFFSWLIGRRILGALSVIERSARQIVQGSLEQLPLPATSDETRGVVEAFNHMLVELEHRQNQLVQEKKLASLGVLTSGIAHQLNNPLNNISTSCQILREELRYATGGNGADGGPGQTGGSGGAGGTGALDPALAGRMLENIHQEVHRSRDIVKGLLEFSRETEFSLKPVALRDVVGRSVALVASEVPACIAIDAEVPGDIVLPLDVQRFQEVLLNLLINAIQAVQAAQERDGNAPEGSMADGSAPEGGMPDGKGPDEKRPDGVMPDGACPRAGAITVTATRDVAARQVVLRVADTGIGIGPEHLGRIFDPFFTLKEVGKGTGLGLSVAFGIIRKHGGSIGVESTPGAGTCFTIRLPLGAPEPTGDAA
ncbi:sensor histidine kinase [Nitratidesulfovibrio sp. SRB-5]|uniref:sensor histidine kinase n=1 Tax=Nitratidesulfovibrio sp. SRB-5 TaxID=2872636 RepID=UPI001027C058|nr:sensor histidine kinase [Nitratidesulfovibrio sp. SRB-5]MBZ2173275.1 HAMP domain-containing protein [Nitratidesulfovibrio sp. SRB-5]RXF75813.1 sensor histidine kinase [Desulfovibrio sp. DS-1]